MTARLLRRLNRPSSRRSRNDLSRDTSSAIERLEDRTLLAGMWTDAFPAGTDGFVGASGGANALAKTHVAVAADGHYAVLWQDSVSGTPLFFRRFAANGTPLDANQRYLGVNFFDPSVGMAADGSFVIAYRHYDPTAGIRVAFTRFAADGSALTDTVPIGSATRASDGAEIAVARDGRFVITWVEQSSATDYDIAFDVFAADGSSANGYFYADTAAGFQQNPDVAINPVTGEFTIAYEDAPGATTDVYRTIHRPDGTQLAGKRRLHVDAAGDQYDPAVAMNAAGDISVVWEDNDGVLRQIWHGTENYYGLPGTSNTETIIASTGPGVINVSDPTVARSEGRNTFVIIWGESSSSETSKQYRQYNLASNPAGEPARTLGGFASFGMPAVAMNARGDYVVAYHANRTTGGVTRTQVRADFHRFQPFDQIGGFKNGVWTLDLNFNNVYDTGDTTFNYGQAGDLPVTGDWDGDGLTEVGVFRNGIWILDVNGNRQADAADVVFIYGQAGDQPVVGDWNHDGIDEVGVFRSGLWFLDANRSYSSGGGDAVYQFGAPGDIPVVVDPDNSGRPAVAVFRGGIWSIDVNRNGQWDGVGTDGFVTYGTAGDLPIAGNWLSPNAENRTGRDQTAVLRGGNWLLDLDEDFEYEASDRQTVFGGPGMQPVRGVWAPFATKSPTSVPQRREVAIFRNGTWVLDGNGDGQVDGTIDLVFHFGLAGDKPVGGDCNADGFDEIGVFRGGVWYLDVNGSFAIDAADAAFAFGLAGDQPVVGDWNGDGRDDVGVVRGGVWYLDYNGNRGFDVDDRILTFGAVGAVAVTGDWNGDGRDEIGVFHNGAWALDYDGNGSFTSSDRVVPAFGLAGDQPVAGDWNGDGFDDIGVMRGGEWYLDRNGSDGFDPWDWIFSYGLAGDLALAGRWRVPA